MPPLVSTFTNTKGEHIRAEYYDATDLSLLPDAEIKEVRAYCFLEDKLVCVYAEAKKYWNIPGGAREEESVVEALHREVREETNMKIVQHATVGYRRIENTTKGLVYIQAVFACVVEPEGDFVGDPDGDITDIALVNPSAYKTYFDWGEAGDHMLQSALQVYKGLVV